MSIVADAPVLIGRAPAGTQLTPDEMVTKCAALLVNDAFQVGITEYDSQDNRAERMSFQQAWRSKDEMRELVLYRYDRVSPDGGVSREQFIQHDMPWPVELNDFLAALAELWRLGYEAGQAEEAA